MNPTAHFDTIPVNAEEQFRLRLLGAILDILERERRAGQLDEYMTHFAFLQSYANRIANLWQSEKLPLATNWQRALSIWQGSERLPLDRLAELAPNPVTEHAVLMIAAIEEDPRFSLLIEPEGGAPTLGGMTVFLCDLHPDLGTGEIREQLFVLAGMGILSIGNSDQPRIEWTMRVAPAAFEAITGTRCDRSYLNSIPGENLPSPKQWIAPSPDADQPTALGDQLSQRAESTIVLRGDSNNGRKTYVRMAARRAKMGTIEASTSVFADEGQWSEANLIAALSGAILMVECSPAPSERVTVPTCSVRAPHLALVTSQSASVDHGRSGTPVFAIELPRPDQKARAKHWRTVGWSRDARKLSERVLTSGHIHRMAQGADRETRDESVAAMEKTLLSLRDPRLETTAQRVSHNDRIDDLVVENEEREELDNLVLRCRLREALQSADDAGVRALFSGPSGSGKTLAAKHLARDLKRPLYRIDLAATVNKYIGETEKNLEQALAAAEELDVVLLLDEGDALLAKRTDVGSATDRYANMETNFLLQRLEAFRGIILITTNDGERIDSAFRRRMDAIIPFHLPDQLSRQEILKRQLGKHKVSTALIDEIACRCGFSGGQLHNIVTHARLLSLADKSPIGDAHVVKSVKREYRKTGEHCPLRPALAKAS